MNRLVLFFNKRYALLGHGKQRLFFGLLLGFLLPWLAGALLFTYAKVAVIVLLAGAVISLLVLIYTAIVSHSAAETLEDNTLPSWTLMVFGLEVALAFLPLLLLLSNFRVTALHGQFGDPHRYLLRKSDKAELGRYYVLQLEGKASLHCAAEVEDQGDTRFLVWPRGIKGQRQIMEAEAFTGQLWEVSDILEWKPILDRKTVAPKLGLLSKFRD